MKCHNILNASVLVSLLSGSSLIAVAAFGQDSQADSAKAPTELTRLRLERLDRDNDGLPDVIERRTGMNPKKRDSNNNGIWDSDETDSKRGMTYGQAYMRGYYRDSEDGEGDDGDDDIGAGDDHATTGVTTRRPLPLPTCSKRGQRNCKPAICRSKAQSRLKICKPPGKAPPPTPKPIGAVTPGQTPKPTVAPVVPPPTGNFDASGNTTKFGIPAGMTGNVSAGAAVQSSSCGGCHGEKQSRSFGQIKGSLSIGAMSFIKLSDPQIANLTAYLNRFNK